MLLNRNVCTDSTGPEHTDGTPSTCPLLPAPSTRSWQAILKTGCLRAPKPLAFGTMPLGGSFLLMEHMPFIPFGQSIPEVLKNLAEGLAAMHLQEPPADVLGFGFYGDNFLGGTRQINAWDSDFSTFFVEKRLLPQFANAKLKFKDSWGTSNDDFERIGGEAIRTAKKVLEPVANSKPALLHGGESWGAGRDRRGHTYKAVCRLSPPLGLFDPSDSTVLGSDFHAQQQ